jgi:hypothetical protein
MGKGRGKAMAGYLEEKLGGDGTVMTWQTPNRQRLWGLVAALIPAMMIAHGLYGFRRIVVWEVAVGAVLLFGAFLVATWTVKFSLDLNKGRYEFVKGFLPVLLGERGRADMAFQCIAVRSERFDAAARHDVDAQEFLQYRVFAIWKQARKEAMLLDTVPDSYQESLDGKDHYRAAMEHARRIAEPLGLEVQDHARVMAAVLMEEPAGVGQESETV